MSYSSLQWSADRLIKEAVDQYLAINARRGWGQGMSVRAYAISWRRESYLSAMVAILNDWTRQGLVFPGPSKVNPDLTVAQCWYWVADPPGADNEPR